MLFEGNKVILCHGVVDLRKGAEGLIGLVAEPEPGTWYLFSNRTRRLIKCVRTDRTGIWMASRRLKQGYFHWLERAAGSSVITVSDADTICRGDKIKRRPSDFSACNERIYD